jgi:carboxymethylenebutenolidase
MIARFIMVKPDGTALHVHKVYNLNVTNFVMEANNTVHVFEGAATVTLKDGPVSNVPLTVKIFNNAVIAIWIGTDKTDSHFGAGSIYGTLSPASTAVMEDAHNLMVGSTPDDQLHGTKPSNATSVELPRLARTLVSYYANATGYLVYPSDNATEPNKLPAVVMIHEWWGLNQNIKNMAEQLANEGYVVLAVDLYNGEVATESGRAGELSRSVRSSQQTAVENLRASVQYVSSLPNVNASRVASLGWCFGGGYSLQLALNSEAQPLAATVIYYGTLVTERNELSKISWPVLGVFGSTDQSIPVDTVRKFESALDASGITNEIYVYEGVGHAFANPSGDNYAPEETADAWKKTLDFLGKYV